MKSLEQFIIPFSGLKVGFHRFDFKVDRAFFEAFEFGEIRSGSVGIVLALEKKERMLVFDFSLSGTVDLPCDRCGEMMDIPVKGEERLIVKLGEAYRDEGEEVIIIPETDKQFDVSRFLYEVLHLMIPAKRVHPESGGRSTCNPEILKKLEELSGHHEPDPRWEALKKLKANHKSKI